MTLKCSHFCSISYLAVSRCCRTRTSYRCGNSYHLDVGSRSEGLAIKGTGPFIEGRTDLEVRLLGHEIGDRTRRCVHGAILAKSFSSPGSGRRSVEPNASGRAGF